MYKMAGLKDQTVKMIFWHATIYLTPEFLPKPNRYQWPSSLLIGLDLPVISFFSSDGCLPLPLGISFPPQTSQLCSQLLTLAAQASLLRPNEQCLASESVSTFIPNMRLVRYNIMPLPSINQSINQSIHASNLKGRKYNIICTDIVQPQEGTLSCDYMKA